MTLELVAREILESGNLLAFAEYVGTNSEKIDINHMFEEKINFLIIVVQTFRKFQSLIADKNDNIQVEDYKNAITTLVRLGCNINSQDVLGRSVCHWCIVLKSVELLSVCLNLGYNTLLQDNEGQTIAHLAIRHMDHMVLETIKLYGGDAAVFEEASSASGATPLIYSVQIGANDIVRNLLKLSVNVDQQESNKYKRTALHYALFTDNEEIFEQLLKHGAKTNIKDYKDKSVLDRVAEHPKETYLRKVTHYSSADIFASGDVSTTTGYSPLMIACKNNDFDMVCELVRTKGGLLSQDSDQRTALHYCADNTDTKCAEKLLERAPDLIGIKDKNGFSILHLATISNNVKLVQLLLAKECDVMNQDNEGHTCLHWGVVCGAIEIISILVDNYPNIIHIGDNFGASPLHYATQTFLNPDGALQGPRVMEELLRHDATDINCVDGEQRSPLLWAACLGLSQCCQMLLEHGANVSQRNDKGLTVLHCAVSRGHYDVVELLINIWSVPVDLEDDNLCTPLFYAVTLRHLKITEFLLDQRSNPNHRDIKGRTVVHCAALKGYSDVLGIICNAGASVSLQNNDGDLPLHEAVETAQIDACLFVLEKMKETSEIEMIDTTNNLGYTCLHKAALHNHTEICQLLIQYGANVNVRSSVPGKEGIKVTPLDLATEDATITVLKDSGAEGGKQELLQEPPTSEVGETKSSNDCSRSHNNSQTDIQGPKVDLAYEEVPRVKLEVADPKKHSPVKGREATKSSRVVLASLVKDHDPINGKTKTRRGISSTSLHPTYSGPSARVTLKPVLPRSPTRLHTQRSTANNSAKSSLTTNDSGTTSSGSSHPTPCSSITFHHEARPPDLQAKIIKSVREYERMRDHMRSISDQRRMEMFEGFAKSAKLNRVALKSRTSKSVKQRRYGVREDSGMELPLIVAQEDRRSSTRTKALQLSSDEQVKSAYHCDLSLSTLII